MRNEFCKCAQKVCRTEQECKVVALEKYLRAYKCEFCASWHLTSKDKRVKYPRQELEETDID